MQPTVMFFCYPINGYACLLDLSTGHGNLGCLSSLDFVTELHMGWVRVGQPTSINFDTIGRRSCCLNVLCFVFYI